MELENHTYTHPAFYRMTTEEMAWEIYMNNRAVSETLGVDYQMHFMRHARRRQPPRFAHPPVHGKDGDITAWPTGR